MVKKIATLSLLAVISLGCQSQKQISENKKDTTTTESGKKNNGDMKPYKEVITAEAKSDSGLFVSHFVGNNFISKFPMIF